MSALEWFPPVAVPPTYEQMAEAIEHFAHEFYAVFSDDEAMPADVPLLRLAERLASAREHAKAHPVVPVPAVCQGCADGTIDNHIYGHGENAAETRVAGSTAVLGGEGDC